MAGAWQMEKSGLPNGRGKSGLVFLDAVIFTAAVATLRAAAGNLPGLAAKFSPSAGIFTVPAANGSPSAAVLPSLAAMSVKQFTTT